MGCDRVHGSYTATALQHMEGGREGASEGRGQERQFAAEGRGKEQGEGPFALPLGEGGREGGRDAACAHKIRSTVCREGMEGRGDQTR
eukprot:2179496-Rhodomonas_salina.1